jgi:hypothetical protein
MRVMGREGRIKEGRGVGEEDMEEENVYIML